MSIRWCTWLVCCGALIRPAPAQQQNWIEDSFSDFADGELDASGQNLYVSRDGHVRTIHRFDLNQDGYLDLIFNSTHDLRFFVPATQGTVDRQRQPASSPLAVEGSIGVALADLNRDGHADAVFCPNYNGLQNNRRMLTILWGGDDGWAARRSNGFLPVHAAADVAIADLNADDWPDITILNGEAWLPGQPGGRILRIYWGGPHGYLLTRRRDLGVPDALDLTAADFDGDGAGDLAVLRKGGIILTQWSSTLKDLDEPIETSVVDATDTNAQCLSAADIDGDGRMDLLVGSSADRVGVIRSGPGRDWQQPEIVPARPATHIAAGDLDDDGHLDLALTRFARDVALGGEALGSAGRTGTVNILWGARGRYSSERSTPLSVRDAAATALGDIDGDGRTDLVAAIHQGKHTLATESTVFFGNATRNPDRGGHGFQSEGATDVAVAPPEGDLPARVVIANSLGGFVGEKVPLHLYWGGPDGFDAFRRTEIPFRSGYESSCADLNADGYPDLIAINSQHGGGAAVEDPNGGANIFWGSAHGFDFTGERTVLRESFIGTSNVADLNRDGYLDLVLGAFDAVSPDRPTAVIIHYGSADGFTPNRRVAIPCPGRSIGSVIADFNRDAWLDIAVTSMYEDRVRIFLGSADGFDADRKHELELPDPIAIETADLNADGHLDLIVGSYRDPVTHEHDMGTAVFWGGADGFQPFNAQRLPGWAPVGPCVADFDRDGFLDLFTPCYQGEKIRETLPSYLYWGGPDGFAPRRRTPLICDAAHDALAGDFDRDGRLDLAVSCHSKDGDHYTDSRVFFNDGRRFEQPRVQRLPTHGPHWIWQQDMGHIAHRKWEQVYTSSVHKFNEAARGGTIRTRADVPPGATLTVAIRSADELTSLGDQPWRVVEESAFTLSASDRAMQYRAVFTSDNGDRYPVLDRVAVEFMPARR
jgi:hypothetical protein